MFRPLYRPSPGWTYSYYKANYTMYSVYVFNEVSCTSIKFPFKMITVVIELKSYYNIRGTKGSGRSGAPACSHR
jgi:hypothetical protein